MCQKLPLQVQWKQPWQQRKPKICLHRRGDRCRWQQGLCRHLTCTVSVSAVWVLINDIKGGIEKQASVVRKINEMNKGDDEPQIFVWAWWRVFELWRKRDRYIVDQVIFQWHLHHWHFIERYLTFIFYILFADLDLPLTRLCDSFWMKWSNGINFIKLWIYYQITQLPA